MEPTLSGRLTGPVVFYTVCWAGMERERRLRERSLC